MQLRTFVWQILRPYRFYLLGMFVSGLLWGLYVTISPYLIKLIIDGLAAAKPIDQIYPLAIAYVLLDALLGVGWRFVDWIKYKILPGIKKDTALSMFDYIKDHAHVFFQNQFAGSISNRVNDMVVNLESLCQTTDQFFSNLVAFVMALVVMYWVNPLFALGLLLWCAAFFTLSMLFSRQIYARSKTMSEAYSTYFGRFVDIITNISSVRLFARSPYERYHLESSVDVLCDRERSMQIYIIKMRFAQDISFVTLWCVMFCILLHLYGQGKVSIGDFALILTITNGIFHSMWFVANQLTDVYKSIGRCAQAMSLLNTPHGVVDKPGAAKLVVDKGTIEFCNVTFSYPNCPPIFIDTTVCIEGGSKVGLVGYSGSGKSTFINLILRLYDVDSGTIEIDGQNVTELCQASLRSNISMIPQDVNLFHRTLFENIQYGNVEASKKAVIEASKKAHCHGFISELSQGYDTLVGERGIKLSGGQRQRIAIARAFLEDAPILLLDEATSALDSVTEKQIQESLHTAIQHRTTIVIAHRLSTLLEMDRILVFKGGKIIEDGSHKALLAKKGHYAQMWSMQAGGFLPEHEES